MTPESVPAIAAVAVGTYFTSSFTRDLYLALQSKQWPRTRGRVLVTDIDVGVSTRYQDNSALVAYEYEVHGVKYRSKRIDYAGRGAGRSALKFFRQYSEGQVVDVLYDPAEPSRAILLPGITSGNIFRLLCALLITVFGVALLLAS
jgi:hypothetical protein